MSSKPAFKILMSLLLLSILFLQGVSKHQAPTSLRGVFCRMSSETFWIYEFINDSAYEYRTRGHFGDTRTIGTYAIMNDTIKLFPYKETRQRDKHYFEDNEELVIKGDSLLLSPGRGEFYCKLTKDSLCCSY